MTALLDTGFLLALIARNDAHHLRCVRALRSEPRPLVPTVILPELAYLVLRDLGYPPLLTFLDSVLHGRPPLVFEHAVDIARATELLEQYADAKVDYTDCVVVAMAERLGIQRICTLDQRHFRLFRPRHVTAFEILP